MKIRLLISAGLFALTCVVFAVSAGHVLTAGDGAPTTRPTTSEDIPFECRTDCSCKMPETSLVYCITNPKIRAAISGVDDCRSYAWNEDFPEGRAYVAIGNGKRPDGCKGVKAQTNCDEISFECYRFGYCAVSEANTCKTDPLNQGFPEQATKRVVKDCD